MAPRHAPRASELGVMTQFAVRIGSILLICVAATQVVAGPRGGAPFGGGGVRFGGGGGAVVAPHIAAPHVVAPHLSAPSFAPHLSTPHFSAPLPFITPVGPQRFAGRWRLPQAIAIRAQGRPALLVGPVRHSLAPALLRLAGAKLFPIPFSATRLVWANPSSRGLSEKNGWRRFGPEPNR